ncbi:MAG: bestrophin family ion channel [Saprospiraceae bacterium]|nr:bestrophin family ion channel [Saprospiraceae bacterium]
MIYYKTNQNWFGDVRHLATSWTMVRIMRSVIGIGLYATALCVVVDYFNWQREINMNMGVFSLLGVMLSILLVFRTNSAYDRWWEGRKQWGALVNNSRNLAIYVQTMFPKEDQEVRHFMAVRIANFCIALVEHLRNGVQLEKLIFLSKTEKATYASKDHIPNQIALEIFDRIAESHRRGELSEGDYLNIKAQQESLLDILGACERIKKTPIPFSYAVYLKIFISAYALMLPFALVTTFHYSTIPLSMLLFFALLGVELLGEEIEDPFGLDCNDLPTGDIAHTIKKNVFEILNQKQPDLEERERALYEKVF